MNTKRAKDPTATIVSAAILLTLLLIFYVNQGSPSEPLKPEHNPDLVTELDPFVRTGTYEPPPKYSARVIPATTRDKLFGNRAVMTAYRTATNYVSELLRAPASAQFSPIERTGIKTEGRHVRVAGYVDSQNGFGALIRSKYVLLMEGDLNFSEMSVEAVKVIDPVEETEITVKAKQESFLNKIRTVQAEVDKIKAENPSSF